MMRQNSGNLIPGTNPAVVLLLLGILCLFLITSCDEKPEVEDPANGEESSGETENSPPAKRLTEADVLELWPDDIPLMESYKLQNFLLGAEGAMEMTIVIPIDIQQVFDFYIDALEVENEWEIDEEYDGIPGSYIDYEVRKDGRLLGVLITWDPEAEKTIVILSLITE